MSKKALNVVTEPQYISFGPLQNVDAWDQTEEVPTGTREKVTLIEPETGKHYIFKYPKERREHQIWSELLASFIAGDLLRWEVQTTSIAERDGRLGNLLGYIYEPGSETAAQETFIEGWTLCTQVDPDFDVDRGTRHTLPLLLQVCDEVLVTNYGMTGQSFLDFWACAFALDCLISNTDRHAENWAIITGPGGARMAPLYDNGSSMGCGIEQRGLKRALDNEGALKTSHLIKQRDRGRHHVRTDEPGKHGGFFEEISKAFLSKYPDGRVRFEAAEAVDIDAVCDVMDCIGSTMDLEEPYLFSEIRQQHIYAMLQIGVERIRNVLRKDDD